MVESLTHRIKAIKSFNEQLSMAPTQSADADALFATVTCLLTQAALLPDGMVEYFTLLRISYYVVKVILPSFPTADFHTFTPEEHVNALSSIASGQPIDFTLASEFRESLELIEAICCENTQIEYISQQKRCIAALSSSCRRGAFTELRYEYPPG